MEMINKCQCPTYSTRSHLWNVRGSDLCLIGPDLGICWSKIKIMRKGVADEIKEADDYAHDGFFPELKKCLFETRRDVNEMGGCYVGGKWEENGNHRFGIEFELVRQDSVLRNPSWP